MNKLIIIYGKNTHNTENIDTIYIEPEPYYNFHKIKYKIKQYDFIIFLDDTIDYDKLNISKSIEYIIDQNLDQVILHNCDPITLEIMEYDYYKKIIK